MEKIRVKIPLELAVLLGVVRHPTADDDKYAILRMWCLHTVLSEGYSDKIPVYITTAINRGVDNIKDRIFPFGEDDPFAPSDALKTILLKSSLGRMERVVKSKEFKRAVSTIDASSSDTIELDIPIDHLLCIVFAYEVSDPLRMMIIEQLDEKGFREYVYKMQSMEVDKTKADLTNRIGKDAVDEIEKTVLETLYLINSNIR